jgi:hypothetical protein
MVSLSRQRGTEVDPRISHRRFLDRVEYILKRQVDIAAQEHHNAMFEFWEICSEAGSVDLGEVEKGERRRDLARDALVLAFKRSNDFVLNGTVPRDLEFLRLTEKREKEIDWCGHTGGPQRID